MPTLKKPEPGYLADNVLGMWNRFSDRTKKKLIAQDKKLRAEGKGIPQKAAPVRFNAAKEKARAKSAYRLQKWKDQDYSKIPQTPAGINIHKALVGKYEADYGSVSSRQATLYEKTYKAILDGISAEKLRVDENKKSSAETKVRQAAERERKDRKNAVERERRASERMLTQARDSIKSLSERVSQRTAVVSRAGRDVRMHEKQLKYLTDWLGSKDAKKASYYNDMVKAAAKRRRWLGLARKSLKLSTAELKSVTEQLSLAQKTVEGNK